MKNDPQKLGNYQIMFLFEVLLIMQVRKCFKLLTLSVLLPTWQGVVFPSMLMCMLSFMLEDI